MEVTEVTKSMRYRVNIKETAKHERYWDCTVDGTGYAMADVVAASDLLVEELASRYPVIREEK